MLNTLNNVPLAARFAGVKC